MVSNRVLHRRRFIYLIIGGAILITALGVSTFFSEAARPFRHYTEDGNTSFTQLWPDNITNLTWNAINGDNPVCEWQVGDNNTGGLWLCLNRTAYYNCSGNTCSVISSSGGGAPTSASYVTMSLDGTLSAERVLTEGTGITLVDGGANGAATVSVTGLETCNSANASTWNGSEWNCFNASTFGDGNGTVTSISQGFGISLTPNPITSTGSVAWDNNSLTEICDTPNDYSSWNGSMFVCEPDGTGAADGNNYSTSVTVTGTSTKNLTINEVSGYITTTYTDYDTVDGNVSSFTQAVNVNGSVNVTVTTSNSTTYTIQIQNQTSSFTDTDTDTNTNVTSVTVDGTTTKTVQINLSDGRSFNGTFTDIDTDTNTISNITGIAVSGTVTKTIQVNTTHGTFTVWNASFTDETGGGSYDLNITNTTATTTIEDSETITYSAAGIATVQVTDNTVTYTCTEVDGSTSNELQNIFQSVVGNTGTTTADSTTDTLNISGVGITTITCSETGDHCNITSTEVDGSTTNELQNLWETIASQSGSTTASTTTDTLTINGGGICTSAVVGDTLTVTCTEVDGSTTNEIQNIFYKFAFDSGNFTANTTQSNYSILGGTDGIDVTADGEAGTATFTFDSGELAVDDIPESKLDFDTACAANAKLYISGNDLACNSTVLANASSNTNSSLYYITRQQSTTVYNTSNLWDNGTELRYYNSTGVLFTLNESGLFLNKMLNVSVNGQVRLGMNTTCSTLWSTGGGSRIEACD